MKKFFILASLILAFTACAPSFYYQVYKVQPQKDLSQSDNSIFYEDENCKVFYDFWSEGGNVGFLFYNKSEKNIYLNLKESFFIYNGIAYDYYKNREFNSSISRSESSMYTHSATTTYSAMRAISGSVSVSEYNLQGFTQTNTISAGAGTSKAVSSGVAETSGTSVSSGFGVTIKEMDIICIPPKSAKVISEYNINKLLYRDCNLFIRPTKKQIRISSFSEDESPFIFSNRISYCVDENGKPITMEHKFYVSEISNIIEEDMTTYKIVKVCEDEQSPWFTGVSRLFYKDPAPDKFFIKYSYPDGYRKH